MTLPFMWALIALKRWMNCPGLTPLAPRAGPIGGAGVAVPPGAWSLNWEVISFLAMTYSDSLALFICLPERGRCRRRPYVRGVPRARAMRASPLRICWRLRLNHRCFDALASRSDDIPEG